MPHFLAKVGRFLCACSLDKFNTRGPGLKREGDKKSNPGGGGMFTRVLYKIIYVA